MAQTQDVLARAVRVPFTAFYGAIKKAPRS
jgi:hypothetical protein